MPLLHALVLGIVQGLSEFLPISSSGHLEVVPWLLGWDDFAGRPELERAFDVAVHVGTLVGAVAYFRADLWRYGRASWAFLRRWFGRPAAVDETDARVVGLLVVSAVPAGIVGLALAEGLEGSSESKILIGTALAVFGLVLLWADRLGGGRDMTTWSLRDALVMGGAQAVALQPGVSRSGVTITAGRWLGLTRDAAARVSFLMSLPVIAGAGLVAWRDANDVGGIPSDLVTPVIWAMLASAVTGYAAVWGTIRLVRTRSFAPFVAYRVAAGVAVIGVAAAGWR